MVLHTPLKSSKETLFAIKLVIKPSYLLEHSIGDQAIFCHRQKCFTRQLPQAYLEHRVSTKVEAFSHMYVDSTKRYQKENSVLTQQYAARIFEARILEDINKSNHVEVDRVYNSDLSPD